MIEEYSIELKESPHQYLQEMIEKYGIEDLSKAIRILVDYEDRMGLAYGIADLAVCRAGATTLAELTAVGLASLLVPSPNVTENHQEHNARGLEKVGAAEVLVEQGWDLDAAVSRVEVLLADPVRLQAMAEAAREQARLDAGRQAADVVEGVLGGRGLLR